MGSFEEIEKKRKRAMILVIVQVAILIPSVIAFIGAGAIADAINPSNYAETTWAIWGIVVVLNVGLLVINSFLWSKFKDSYKTGIVQPALEGIFDNLQYLPESGIPYETIERTNLVPKAERYACNDYIAASYKDVHFESSDVDLKVVVHTKNSTQEVSFLTGRWMIFDFNKDFKANMRVGQKGFVKQSFMQKHMAWREAQKVELENHAFNKRFDVRATSPQEAFYLLTPHFMESLLALSDKLGRKIMLGFLDNKLHICLKGVNAFEPKMFKKISAEKTGQLVAGEICQITDFVEELKMDRTIFKRTEGESVELESK